MSVGIGSQRTGEVVVVDASSSTQVHRLVAQGKARRIVRGVVTYNTVDPLEQVVRRNWSALAAHYFPGAVVVDRSFFDGGPGANGAVVLDVGPEGAKRNRPLELPGLRIYTRRGPGPAKGDVPYVHGLFFSGQTRAFLDNLRPSRRRAGFRRTLSRDESEARLVRLHAAAGDEALEKLRDEARDLAGILGVEDQAEMLDEMIGGLFGTRESHPRSRAGRALRAGVPFDQRRIETFGLLAEELRRQAPVLRLADDEDDQAVVAFYESYFSNYIEGTRFTLEEAGDIVFRGVVPEGRPADAHDIRGTFRLVHPPSSDARCPQTADELIDLLQQRHRVLLAGRPDKRPGRSKERNNQAGSTVFVDRQLVRGTLIEAFKQYLALPEGFARAAFIMFLIAEVHPFADGNGRIARVFMNAELTATGQQRIVLVTGYRQNYLSALTGLTHNQRADAVVRMLDFAHRYTVAVDWSSDQRARRMLERSRAFDEDPTAALRLPDPWDQQI